MNAMTTTLAWDPPGPGPWQQDSAHNPVAQTALLQQAYPEGFNRGFEEAFGGYGVLLDRLAMASINGFTYHQPQPFDLPGPDGPKDPEWIGAEFGRRAGVAAKAFETRIWREAMRRWDEELKPASVARHRALDVDLSSLDDAQLQAHIETCISEVTEMVYQHHRHNAHALVPVGDFLLQVAGVDRSTAGDPAVGLRRVLAGVERRGAGDAARARGAPQGRRGTRPALRPAATRPTCSLGCGRGCPRWGSTSTRCTSGCSTASTSRAPPSASGRKVSSVVCRPHSTSTSTNPCGARMPSPPSSVPPCPRSTEPRSTTC